jgi:RHS repeat-associated protein
MRFAGRLPDSAGTTSYTFDANGRRITETHSGTTTDLYFSMQGQVIEERQGGTVTAQNVWSIDYVNSLLLRDDNSTSGNLGLSGSGLGTRTYYQSDANYNVTAIVGNSGSVIQRYVYTAYGEQTVLSDTWVASSATNSISGFQGGRTDLSTGLIHFDARDYSPTDGRWGEADPAMYSSGMNRYQGFASDPATLVDPLGLAPATTRPSNGVAREGTYGVENKGVNYLWMTPVIESHDLGNCEDAGFTVKLIADRPTDLQSINDWNAAFSGDVQKSQAGQATVVPPEIFGPNFSVTRYGPNLVDILTGRNLPRGPEDGVAVVIHDDRPQFDGVPLISSKWSALDNPAANADDAHNTEANKAESDTFNLSLGCCPSSGTLTLDMYALHPGQVILEATIAWSYDGKGQFDYKFKQVADMPQFPNDDFDYVHWFDDGAVPDTTEKSVDSD